MDVKWLLNVKLSGDNKPSWSDFTGTIARGELQGLIESRWSKLWHQGKWLGKSARKLHCTVAANKQTACAI